jgi:hypothetical protein
VKAAWPTLPRREGQAFAREPASTHRDPLEATLNRLPAEVVNAVTWPGSRDRLARSVLADQPFTGGLAKSSFRKVPDTVIRQALGCANLHRDQQLKTGTI